MSERVFERANHHHGPAAGIPCNVLAGFHHDHLLVPADRAAQAMTVVRELRGDG